MFRAALWTLRQRRYRAVAALMTVIAVICAGAGSFELHRYREKVHDNARLRANAHAPVVPLTTSLVPLVGTGPAPSAFAIRYCTVRVTGTFEPGAEQYVGNQTQGGRQGFDVLTPLRTSDGTLLVVRGFVAARADESRPAHIAAPPATPVTITGRLQTPDTADDHQGRLGRGEITAINPTNQSARLGRPTFQASLDLTAGQPGTAGLRALPKPDLSNPTGGAGAGQLLSYVVQWYVFALLALLAPFLFARSEIRDARRRFLGVDPDAEQFDAPAALPAAPGALVVRRGATALTRPGGVSDERWRRATRLADRYGRSLGIDTPVEVEGEVDDDPRAPYPVAKRAFTERNVTATSSADTPHRSDDAYHGSYNDYLWRLAMADGNIPDVTLPEDASERDDGADGPRSASVPRDGLEPPTSAV